MCVLEAGEQRRNNSCAAPAQICHEHGVHVENVGVAHGRMVVLVAGCELP